MSWCDVLVVTWSSKDSASSVLYYVSILVCWLCLLDLSLSTAAPVTWHEAETGVLLLNTKGLIEDVIKI